MRANNLLYKTNRTTHNKVVEQIAVYGSAAAFALLLFPFHLVNYMYISTADKYASFNLTLYRFLPVFNANTVKNRPQLMIINGKEKQIDITGFNIRYLELIKRLSIIKIVQLADFGIKSQTNAVVAVMQDIITQTAYTLLKATDRGIKLKNYRILNYESDHITYYVKAVNSINLLSVMGIILYLIRGKLHELKN